MTPQFVHNIAGRHQRRHRRLPHVRHPRRQQRAVLGPQPGRTDRQRRRTTDVSAAGAGDQSRRPVVRSRMAAGITTAPLMPDNRVQCWGRNARGQVGDGTTDIADHSAAHVVIGLTGVNALSLGGYHCARCCRTTPCSAGAKATYGQIGSPAAFSQVPFTVPGLTDVTALSQRASATTAPIARRTAPCAAGARTTSVPARRRHDRFDGDAGRGAGHRRVRVQIAGATGTHVRVDAGHDRAMLGRERTTVSSATGRTYRLRWRRSPMHQHRPDVDEQQSVGRDRYPGLDVVTGVSRGTGDDQRGRSLRQHRQRRS